MSKPFLWHWLMTAAALAVTALVLPGVRVDGVFSLALAGLVLGFVNAVVRPLLLLVTLPFTVLTLGLFYFVVNGLAFGLAAFLVPGFSVASFFSAMLGAFAVGLVSWLIGSFTGARPPSRGSMVVDVRRGPDGRWGA